MKGKAEWSNLAMTSTEDWITNYSDDQVQALIDRIAATFAQTTMSAWQDMLLGSFNRGATIRAIM